MELGFSYVAPHLPRHIRTDVAEMASVGATHVMFALQENHFRYLRGAFEHRSKDAIADSDHCIFIHDGTSKGTFNEMKLAKKMGIPFDHHELAPAEHDKSVGFDIEVDWDQLLLDDTQLEDSLSALRKVNV